MAELTFLKIAKRNKGLYVALAGLLIAAIVINFATGVNFFKISNLLNVTRSFCILGIASIGQAIVIISGSGGLDLSIGHVISTANVIAAALMEGSNALFIPVTLLILIFGVTVGLINGLLVTKRNVPPFIATLGMGIVLKGLRFMWTEGLPKGKVPAILIEIGNEFLQPANNREGRYGGSFENRTRFFREVIEGIKQQVDDGDFLLGVRISAYEGVPGGFGTAGPGEIAEDLSEPVAFVKLAQEAGLHLISASAGNAAGSLEILLPTDDSADAVFRHFGWTRTIKQSIDIPVIGAGYSYLRDGRNKLPGEDSAKKSFVYWAEKNLKENNVDLVGIARQAIADPALPKKILNGDLKSVNWCTMCMDCGMLLGEQQEVGCSVYDRYYKELAKKIKAQA